ncbi:hypothetical protein COT60_02670 [Candidatus Pacearchaeota archaeon CG09_land_8_20_14_0_10_30_9]|nr:MAG: hypothetical protein COT60_02670 [Candidatus Pacearchaeota archaeon CG09_land_8_20_14_0_10_30_9]PJA71272.1 MAG: hypothetical protein CO153_02435 [Candidatus Pacearchaeota archaeon CG_4_9_14_3_um_filter_30_11]
MKKILITLILGLFLVSFVSAGMSFSIQPHSVYNFGDKINTTLDISSNGEFNEIISINLKCGNGEVQVYKEFLSLSENLQKNVMVPVVKNFIGNLSGECKLDVFSGNKLEISSSLFKVSNSLKIEFLNWKDSFTPNEQIRIEGSAIKENGNNVDGTYFATIDDNNFSGEVNNGEFSISFKSPSDFLAGNHKFILKITEEEKNGEILNYGEKVTFLNVLQVPISIEVVLDKKDILPGEKLKGKVVLHDQTGESIPRVEVYVAVKNNNGEIIKKIISKTETPFEYLVEKNQSPSIFQVSAYSNDLINGADFNILENREISSEIINRTLTLTNTGNIFYEGDLILYIGLDNVSIPLSLPVGGYERYTLSAPDGDYDITVGSLKKRVSLSGNAIQVQKINQTEYSFTPFIWTFVLVVLAFGAYFIFKKWHKPHTFARSKKQKNVKKISEIRSVHESIPVFDSKKKVELSLSIVGTKQNATLGCISIKNYPEISSGQGNVKETFLRIEQIVEENKGFVYQNESYLFFILAPAITRTFKNQKVGVLISQQIKNILNEHNKKFKQRIEFGISVNYGTVITKIESNKIQFMSLGTLITTSKKLASFSLGKIIVSDKLLENMEEKIKGDLVQVGSLKGYKLENLVDKNSHSTFIKGFLARQERDKLKETNSEKKN